MEDLKEKYYRDFGRQCIEFQPKIGELFGIIFDYKDLVSLSPDIHISETIEVDVNDSLGLQYDYNYTSSISESIFSDVKDIPMILKKIDEGVAQDILTGIIFRIGNLDEDMTDCEKFSDGDIQLFQKNYQTLSENPIYINLGSVALFPVEDNFKSMYSECIISRKEEIISKIQEFYNMSKENFEKEFKQGIETTQKIANTDNMIFDFEKGNLKK